MIPGALIVRFPISPSGAGCLAAMAPCDEEACLEMIDFGVMPPLLWMARSESPILEVRPSAELFPGGALLSVWGKITR